MLPLSLTNRGPSNSPCSMYASKNVRSAEPQRWHLSWRIAGLLYCPRRSGVVYLNVFLADEAPCGGPVAAEDGQRPVMAAGESDGISHGYRPHPVARVRRSEEHTSELQSLRHLGCR